MLSVAAVVSPVFSLHYITSWGVVMSYNCCCSPSFAIRLRLHSHVSTLFKFLHTLAGIAVIVLFLMFFSLLQVFGDFILIVTGWSKQTFHHRQLIFQSASH